MVKKGFLFVVVFFLAILPAFGWDIGEEFVKDDFGDDIKVADFYGFLSKEHNRIRFYYHDNVFENGCIIFYDESFLVSPNREAFLRVKQDDGTVVSFDVGYNIEEYGIRVDLNSEIVSSLVAIFRKNEIVKLIVKDKVTSSVFNMGRIPCHDFADDLRCAKGHSFDFDDGGICAVCGLKRKTKLDEVMDKGYITIAVSPDYPPFEFIDENGNITGFEVELFKKIADSIGMKVNIQSVDFGLIISGVVSGKYDMGVSGFPITEERKRHISYSRPYVRTGTAAVVRDSDKYVRIKSVNDLRGKKVSVLSGSTSDTFCVENGLNVNAYATNTEAELALAMGKVDVWAVGDTVGTQMIKLYNADHSEKLVMLNDLLSYEEYAFVVAKGSDSLVKAINDQLVSMKEDGTIRALFEKYEMNYSFAY